VFGGTGKAYLATLLYAIERACASAGGREAVRSVVNLQVVLTGRSYRVRLHTTADRIVEGSEVASDRPRTEGDDGDTPAPLANLRVIEMGQLLAGPFCGQLLGDFGAEVIKVEQPGPGDPMRQWGRNDHQSPSLWWPVLARNKKSVTINLREPSGQDLVRSLVERADVLIENFRPGTLERWGLSYECLSEINPRLILVRVTGFGQTGPYAKRAGYGSIGEAMGGLRHVTGEPDRPPSRTGISIGDSLAGTFAALGTLVALHARQTTGRGQVVDAAIYEAVLALMESTVPEYAISGHVRGRTGAILPNVSPSNLYRTADDENLLIAANQDTVFRRLADVMGRPELADDPRYATHAARGEHQAELDDLIARWARRFEAEYLSDLLEAGGVPAGRIFRAGDMLEDPHFQARQSIVSVPHPEFGEFPMQNVMPKLSETPGQIAWPGPALGAHNREVLQGLLGLVDDELDRLAAKGVI
jgi:formyl-CoA transferase